jgi:hypothetical protein
MHTLVEVYEKRCDIDSTYACIFRTIAAYVYISLHGLANKALARPSISLLTVNIGNNKY